MLGDSHRQAGKPRGSHHKESGCPSSARPWNGRKGESKLIKNGSKGSAVQQVSKNNPTPSQDCQSMGSVHFLVTETERDKEEKIWKKTINFAEHLDAKQHVTPLEMISYLTTILQNRCYRLHSREEEIRSV